MSSGTLLQVWVEDGLAERLDAVCARHGMKRPEVMRRALADAVARMEDHPPALPAPESLPAQ